MIVISVSVVYFMHLSDCNTASIRDNPYWTSRKNSLELTELSSINKVSLCVKKLNRMKPSSYCIM